MVARASKPEAHLRDDMADPLSIAPGKAGEYCEETNLDGSRYPSERSHVCRFSVIHFYLQER